MIRSSKFFLVAALLGAACATHAQEAMYGTPRSRSYVGAPLIAELDVTAPPGGSLSIPCVKVLKSVLTQGAQARDSVSAGSVAISRTDTKGTVQIRSLDIVRASPVLLTIETGCTKPTRVEYLLDVAAAPAPMADSTPMAPPKAPVRKGRVVRAVAGATPGPTSSAGGNAFDAAIVLDRVREMPRLPSTNSSYH